MNLDAETIIYIILDIIIACIVVTGNIVVCYVIIYSTLLRRKVRVCVGLGLSILDWHHPSPTDDLLHGVEDLDLLDYFW